MSFSCLGPGFFRFPPVRRARGAISVSSFRPDLKTGLRRSDRIGSRKTRRRQPSFFLFSLTYYHSLST